jgi:cell division protein FtsB
MMRNEHITNEYALLIEIQNRDRKIEKLEKRILDLETSRDVERGYIDDLTNERDYWKEQAWRNTRYE